MLSVQRSPRASKAMLPRPRPTAKPPDSFGASAAALPQGVRGGGASLPIRQGSGAAATNRHPAPRAKRASAAASPWESSKGCPLRLPSAGAALPPRGRFSRSGACPAEQKSLPFGSPRPEISAEISAEAAKPVSVPSFCGVSSFFPFPPSQPFRRKCIEEAFSAINRRFL